MADIQQQAIANFHRYPPIGGEDWRYTFAVAQVRVLGAQMLSRAAMLDLANAEDFEQAVELLSSTEYALPQSKKTIAELENILLEKRSEVRKLFKGLMIDEPLVELLRAGEDFANLRLALRRKLIEKPLGVDYSNEGSVPAHEFEEIFEQENYSPLPLYMREAIEKAVLAYYQNKDIRQIDFAIDNFQAEYKIRTAEQLKSVFLVELFRMQVDLINIRTMLRLKLADSQNTDGLIGGGYVPLDRFKHVLDLSNEAIGPLFASTPYYEIVEPGVHYFAANNSFLKIEQHCEDHLLGFLKSTIQITAGPQPVIAYLMLKEHEIRTVRLILTAKRNGLDARLILDRLGE